MEIYDSVDADFYKDVYGGVELPDTFIKDIVNQAADMINEFCNFYFDNHSFDSLPLESDKVNVKKAICAQLEYFYEKNGTTELSGSDDPTSVSIGDYRVSGMKQSNSGMKSLCSQKALRYLRSTGLLYRGVGQY